MGETFNRDACPNCVFIEVLLPLYTTQQVFFAGKISYMIALLYHGKFLWVKFSRKRIFDIHQACMKVAIVYTRDAPNGDLSSCAALWLWMHSLAACGLESLAEVGWLVRARLGTESSRLNQER